MARPIFATVLALAFTVTAAAPLEAQTPTVTSYGAPCPPGTSPLSTQGTPRLGTTFTATGISQLQACTLRACLCNCCLCNRCSGPAFLLLGASRSNATVNLPGLTGHGCPILARPDAVLTGDAQGNVALPIPNMSRLLGLQFNLQRVDTLWQTTRGSTCSQHFIVLSGVALSDGIECVIGL